MKPLEILDRDNAVIAEWTGERWTGACAEYAQELSLDSITVGTTVRRPE